MPILTDLRLAGGTSPAAVISGDAEQQEPEQLAKRVEGLAGVVVAILLALLAQTALLRTGQAMPAALLFVLSAAIGGAAAVRYFRLATAALFSAVRGRPDRRWRLLLAIAVAANLACLVLFAKNAHLTLAWLLFLASTVAAAVAFWLLDGRPRLDIDWKRERLTLIVLGVLTFTAAILRLLWLDSLPFGLWFDAAYSGLQVNRIIADPTFRPVYVGGLAQEPAMYWYTAVPFFKLFGSGSLAIRLPGALASVAGIPAMYLLGRQLFGRKVGLIAAGLLTTLVWGLTFARFAANVSWSPTLDALGLFFFVRALKKGSWTAAGLCGICLGLGLHMYYTSRVMILVTGFAFLVMWLPRARAQFQTAWRMVLAAAVVGIITGSPIGEFAVQHSVEFNSRMSEATVMNQVRAAHSYQPLLDNVKAHLLMFNYSGDRNARHNLPSQPELNFLLAGLFVLGLGVCLARVRRPEYALMPVWWAAMLAGGVFSVAFEAPQSLRTIDEINVVVLLCAIPLALLWDGIEKVWPAGQGSGARGQGSERLERFDAALLEPSPASAGEGRVRVPGPFQSAILPENESGPNATVAPSLNAAVMRPVGTLTLPSPAAAGEGSYRPVARGGSLRPVVGEGSIGRATAWLRTHPAYALCPVWVLAVLWMTNPLYRNMGTSLPASGDTLHFSWILWWTKYSLLNLHQLPFSSSYMFAPQAVAITFPVPLALLGIPLQLLFGLVAAVNLVIIISWAASALTAFLLVKQETGSTAGAFVGSIIFAFAPYKMAHFVAGHMAIFSWPTPLFLLFFLRWCRQGGRRNAVLAGVFLACVGLQDPNQMSFSLVFAVAGLAAFVSWRRIRPTVERAKSLALMGVVGLLVLAPMFLPLFGWIRSGFIVDAPLTGVNQFAPDLFSYFTPSYLHPLWGKAVTALADRAHFHDIPKLVFVGFTALSLSLLALLSGRRENVKRWWLATLFFWVLSMGPLLHAGGDDHIFVSGLNVSLPLPFLIFHELPLIGKGVLVSGYAMVITSCGLAVLAGHGVAWLMRALSGFRLSLAAPVVLGALVAFESLIAPIAMVPAATNPVYSRLAAEPGHQAVLEEPLGWRTELGGAGSLDPPQLLAATVSHKPLVAGYIARAPETLFHFYDSKPALAMFVSPDKPTPDSQNKQVVLNTLHAMGVGYILLHPFAQFDKVNAYVQNVLGAPQFYKDGDVTAYRVP